MFTKEEEDRVRGELEDEYGKTWTTEEATADFNFEGFMAPFATVVRKSDGARGALKFVHMPRFYYDFREV